MDAQTLDETLNKLEDGLNEINERLDRINTLIEKQILKTYNDNVLYKSLRNETIKTKKELSKFEKFIGGNISSISMQTWMLPCDIEETDEEVYIKTPNGFTKGVIEMKYLDICKEYGKNIILT